MKLHEIIEQKINRNIYGKNTFNIYHGIYEIALSGKHTQFNYVLSEIMCAISHALSSYDGIYTPTEVAYNALDLLNWDYSEFENKLGQSMSTFDECVQELLEEYEGDRFEVCVHLVGSAWDVRNRTQNKTIYSVKKIETIQNSPYSRPCGKTVETLESFYNYDDARKYSDKLIADLELPRSVLKFICVEYVIEKVDMEEM